MYEVPVKSVRVVSLNNWQLPFVAKDRKARLRRLPAVLAASGADIIALQEIWSRAERDALILEMRREGFTYAAIADGSRGWLRGRYGNGLLVLSRFALRETPSIGEFSAYTYYEEFFVRKGVMRVPLMLPSGPLDFFNAHLGAVRFSDKAGRFQSLEQKQHAAQLGDLVSFVAQHRTAPTVVVAMDVNLHHETWDPSARGFVAGSLADAHRELSDSLGLESSRSYLVGEVRHSYDRANPYVAANPFGRGPSELVDYVMLNRDSPLFTMGQSRLANEWNISDHYAVVTELVPRVP